MNYFNWFGMKTFTEFREKGIWKSRQAFSFKLAQAQKISTCFKKFTFAWITRYIHFMQVTVILAKNCVRWWYLRIKAAPQPHFLNVSPKQNTKDWIGHKRLHLSRKLNLRRTNWKGGKNFFSAIRTIWSSSRVSGSWMLHFVEMNEKNVTTHCMWEADPGPG